MRSAILLVEEEEAIAEPLVGQLEREGFAVEIATTLAGARVALSRASPDVVLLDVMLPDGDGRDLCRELSHGSDVPVIMLTARSEEVDRVLGLELGADDYVVKPFSTRELAARIRAVLRRRSTSNQLAAIQIGDVRLDPAARTATKAGQPIELTMREFDLLHLLMREAGRVIPREEIMDEVWDPRWFGATKTLDVHIAWLRRKIEDEPSAPRYITTVRGVGYRFLPAEQARHPSAGRL